LGQQPRLHAHRADAPIQIDIALVTAQIAKAHHDRARIGFKQRAGQGANRQNAQDTE
jgi:hypothetical protein